MVVDLPYHASFNHSKLSLCPLPPRTFVQILSAFLCFWVIL